MTILIIGCGILFFLTNSRKLILMLFSIILACLSIISIKIGGGPITCPLSLIVVTTMIVLEFLVPEDISYIDNTHTADTNLDILTASSASSKELDNNLKSDRNHLVFKGKKFYFKIVFQLISITTFITLLGIIIGQYYHHTNMESVMLSGYISASDSMDMFLENLFYKHLFTIEVLFISIMVITFLTVTNFNLNKKSTK